MLQHYGAPTPFVDFTSVADIALYFSVNGNDYIKGDEIDSFFSIYITKKGGTPETARDNDLSGFGNILNASNQLFDCLSSQARCQDEIDAFNAYDKNSNETWECISNLPVILIQEDGTVSISNRRSDLQNGLFIFQGKNSVSCLESHFTGMTTDQVKDNTDRLLFPRIKVYDVHKAALNEAKEYLNEKNIGKDSLGLKTDDFGKEAFEKYLKDLAK